MIDDISITRENAMEAIARLGRSLDISQPLTGRVTCHAIDYARDIRSHPYFAEMKKYIQAKTRTLLAARALPGNFNAIEIGAGGGNLTEALVDLPFGSLAVSDLDVEGCFLEMLQREFGDCPRVAIEQRNLLNVRDVRGQFDIAFSCAVDHHVHFDDKHQFFTNVGTILRPGGFYITADVLLTPYPDGDRIKSAAFFHAVIISEALRKAQETENLERCEQLRGAARISYHAWLNELSSDDEYKVSPDVYQRDFIKAGFEIVDMTKIGPSDNEEHGIYVTVLRRPLLQPKT